ncbi:MAG: hypothetical protein JRG79_16850 [Deltaproteobacteria bacterium]|nr:hypothetical protein [Deltaproteobacteria bacterium]
MGLLVVLTVSLAFSGCDSGEKVVDEVTGNRAVKQYHKSKEDLSKITDRQEERFKDLPDEDKNRTFCSFFMGLIVVLTVSLAFSGCDSGEKVVDEVTGNRAVKQYHQSKEDLSKISDRQEDRFKDIPDEDKNPDQQQ